MQKMQKMLSNYYEIRSELECAHDGPVSKFVLLVHAMKLASQNIYTPEDIAEVLEECLENFEEISSTEFPNSMAL